MDSDPAFTASTVIPRLALIGRQRERVFLYEELGRALAGHGRLALIGGEAGIGKTTLVRDVALEARSRGAVVLTGNCHDLTVMPPYSPWLDLAAGYHGGPALPEFPRALAGGRLSGIDSQSTLFAETLTFFTEVCRRQPAVVVLEDLHWSDSASLELLRFLAAHILELPILLLTTYRVNELTRGQPLYSRLPGLLRSGVSLRLDLKRLDPSSVRELIRATWNLEHADEQRLLDYLERHAEGNPLYATELIRALEAEEMLTPSDGGWRLATLDRVVLPALLTQVIDARIGRLGEATRTPLTIAAVIGEEVPLNLWAEVAEVDQNQLLTIVEQASDAHVLEANRDGVRVRFSHALTRDALYESMLPPRRLIWHRAVAEALMRRPNPDPDAVAHHLGQAGDDRASEWLIKAGNRAQRAYTWLIAAERFIAAAAGLESIEGSDRARGWLLFRAARLLRLADPVRGLEVLVEARRLAAEAGDQVLAGDARYSTGLLTVYADHFGGLSEIVAGIELLEALDPDLQQADTTVALALADSLPRRVGSIESDLESTIVLHRTSGLHHRRGSLPWWFACFGHHTEAIEVGNTFISAAEHLPDPGGLVQSATGHAYQGLGFANAAAGRPAEARQAFETTRAIYRKLDHHGVIALAYLAELRHVALPYMADDIDYRRRLCAESAAAIGQAGGAMPPGFSADIARLSCLVIEGAWDEAGQILSDIASPGNAFFRREMIEAAAFIAAQRGDHAGARVHIHAFLPDGPRQEPGSRQFQEALFFQRLAASLAIDEGDLDGARDWLDAQDTWLKWSGAVLGMAESNLAWARYFRALEDHPTANEHARKALQFASHPRQPMTLIGANRLLGELERARNQPDHARRFLLDALELAGNCEARFERALTLAALAELAATGGGLAESRSFASEARGIAKELRATTLLTALESREIPAPSIMEDEPAFGLTAREVQVLRLVAHGLTDAAVASQLFISPRTVGQHLRSVYAKLDVPSRAAATRIAIERGVI